MITRERILNTAQELFFRHGIRNITMDEIAKALGISKKTLYQVYPNKDDMVLKLTQQFLEKLQEESAAMIKKAANAIEEIAWMLDYFNRLFSAVNPAAIYDMRKYHHATWAGFQEHKESYIRQKIVANLKRGIKEGLYRNDIDIEIISQFRLEQLQMAMDPVAFPPEKYPPKDVHVQLLKHYLFGISSRKGHEALEKYLWK